MGRKGHTRRGGQGVVVREGKVEFTLKRSTCFCVFSCYLWSSVGRDGLKSVLRIYVGLRVYSEEQGSPGRGSRVDLGGFTYSRVDLCGLSGGRRRFAGIVFSRITN